MIEDKFKVLIDRYNKEIQLYKKSYDNIGYLRLIVMIGAIYFIYRIVKGYGGNENLYGMLFLLAFFIGLVIYHNKIKEKIEIAESMIQINKRYLERISGQWINFKDIGEEFIDKNHAYSSDLDIVGTHSLFQLINITSTWKGRRKLAKDLLNPDYDKDEILLRQSAINELYNKLELCESMEYEGIRKKTVIENPEKFLSYISDKNSFIKSKALKKLLYVLPMITIPISIIIIVFKIKKLSWLITIFLVLQIIAWAVGLLKINRVFELVIYFKTSLEQYFNILKLLEKQEFKSEKLVEIKNRLFKGNSESIKAIKQLSGIVDKIDIRSNGLFFIILNVVFLWDYQCILSIEKWKESYAQNIEQWLDDIGEIEALMSLSVLNHINETTVFPEISDDTIILGEGVGHQLIGRDVRVTNNIDMNDNIFIITGSNMSGKTTFLRTIGINLVVAYCGGAVCAEYMKCSMFKICTSMRITDDLKAGISTFYGELIRIKKIIEESRKNEKMIFLIDEIFRGTNSRDRIDGAHAVIRNLNIHNVVGALTTHDMELCSMTDVRIKNYHFKEYYKDNKIYFDYKLRDGKSTTTNAKYLMKIVGIDFCDKV